MTGTRRKRKACSDDRGTTDTYGDDPWNRHRRSFDYIDTDTRYKAWPKAERPAVVEGLIT